MTPRSIRKLHAYAFYVGRTTNKIMGGKGTPDSAGMVLLAVAQTFIVLDVVFGIRVALDLPTSTGAFGSFFVVGVIVSLAFNYFTLLGGDQWRRFEHEFNHYSGDSLFIAAVVLFSLLAASILVATFLSPS